ncbi:hypothetical protein NMY22_g18650 [Coprinellus aureogranulatus]|nr:hypothetical protein NMY22_g18650 [Coprinellus aureogranulatus]
MEMDGCFATQAPTNPPCLLHQPHVRQFHIQRELPSPSSPPPLLIVGDSIEASNQQPARPPSPEWDIEKDLDDDEIEVDTPPRPPSPPRPEDLRRPEHENLPEGQFDIDLDLN